MELSIDKVETTLKKLFSDSDEHVKKLIDDLLEYTKENESDDLKRFVVGLGILKKYGYLDVVYEDKNIPYDAAPCFFDPNTSTITMSDKFNSNISISDFIHETAHAMHAIMLGFEEPPEFKEIKGNFKKDECINIFLAGYVANTSRRLHNIINDISFGLNDATINKVRSTIEMQTSFCDIFDALLDGRLLDGVNITSLTYNEFLRLDPNDEDYEKKVEAIRNEYNRIYNQEGLYDLNYNEMNYYKDVIYTSGHGSSYYSIDSNAFKETIANYMSIKLGCRKASDHSIEMIDNCLTTIFGDSLEKYSNKILDSIFTTFNFEIETMLNNGSIDNRDFFRNYDIKNPLLLSFATDEIKNDKEFMLEYLKNIPKDSVARAYVTRLVGKELCSDEDFLKQLADDNYEVMRMANRGDLSKEVYTNLANYTAFKNCFNVYTLDIDRLENGFEEYKKLASKFLAYDSNNFRAINYNDLLLYSGGRDLYKELAVEASKNHCNLGFISPDKLNVERGDPLYYQIVVDRINDNPFEIQYCNFNYLARIPAMNITKMAISNCLEKIEEDGDLSVERVRIMGMLYGKLGVLDIKDEKTLKDNTYAVIDKVYDDILKIKEKKISEETEKSL